MSSRTLTAPKKEENMNKKNLLAAFLTVAFCGASQVAPAEARDDQKEMLNRMAVQMWMNQQAQQQSNAYNQQLYNLNQQAAAEAEWQRRNGSYPYKDQFGRAYGPYGYAPGANVYGGNYNLRRQYNLQRRLNHIHNNQYRRGW